MQDDQHFAGDISQGVRNSQRYAVLNKPDSPLEGGGGHLGSASALEIGMYVLLSVFCAAMAIFLASCFVYATKYHHSRGVNGSHNLYQSGTLKLGYKGFGELA